MSATLADIQRKYGDSVYPLYKDQMHEPYMQNDNNIGYKGVVLYDEIEDKVQCSECGQWLKRITPTHLYKCSGYKNIQEYKEHYGLNLGTPLNSIKYSQARSEVMKKLRENGVLTTKTLEGCRVKAWKNSVSKRANLKQSVQKKNKNGLCDAQIVSRLFVVYQRAGQVGYSEVKRLDPKLAGVLDERRKRGQMSWAHYFDELESFGVTKKDKGHRYTDVKLIAKLRDLTVKLNKIPSIRDCKKAGIHRNTMLDYFGSWRRAKMMAGLDQLLEEVKGK